MSVDLAVDSTQLQANMSASHPQQDGSAVICFGVPQKMLVEVPEVGILGHTRTGRSVVRGLLIWFRPWMWQGVGVASFSTLLPMHSAVYVLDTNQQLWRFPWGSVTGGPCDQLAALGLDASDKIKLAAASRFRLTLLLSSKLGQPECLITLMDPQLRVAGSWDCWLDHGPKAFEEFKAEAVVQLSVNSYMTVARTVTGKIFHWGLQPPLQLEDTVRRLQKTSNSSQPVTPALQIGDQVRLNRLVSSMPEPGARAVHLGPGPLKYGSTKLLSEYSMFYDCLW